ncbi:unnamed protein product [Pocillopora meandrina]|uniref:Uncharacterized protein n=1 Tax=Pocillopora meandrina TaxID=46732 RepID=A0AAU9X546_9CNID|nr:unnamed protein product [Pocillopora meandrina]
MGKRRFVSKPCVIPTWLLCKDLSFAGSSVINKGNGSVTRDLMSVTSTSSVILFIDVKSRRSYLKDKEL